MELKNAVAVCLISLVSATLVVLIARALDIHAASRLEPPLAQIVEELRAIRSQGGVATSAETSARASATEDGLMVYYFHGNVRCATCRAIESQTRDVVANDFAEELEGGRIGWKILKYDEPGKSELADKFGVHMANVVLARMQNGEVQDWERLDKVWSLVGDKPAFAEFIRSEISGMLADEGPTKKAPEEPDLLDLPLPDTSAPPLPQSEESLEAPLPG